MVELNFILHVLHDHVRTLRAILEDNAAVGDARTRLLRHIAAEEEDHRTLLAGMLEGAPPDNRRRIEIAIDHSRFLSDIIRGEEIQPEFAKSLLEHFQEEHEEGVIAPVPPTASSNRSSAWTVGSLRKGRDS